MTVLENINEISNYKKILLYYAKLFRDITKNSNVSPKYNRFYNSTYFLHNEFENITTFKIAIPFNINKYLDSNGSGLLSCVKEVSNLKRSISDFSVSETQLYDSDAYLNINPTLNAERQFVDTIVKLYNCDFPDLTLSLFSKEETNYDESKQELNLNEINVNYSNILIEADIKHGESFSSNIQNVKRSVIKTKKITKVRNNFTFKKAIKNKPTSLMYDFSFRIETERIEKTHKIDVTDSIDDIFKEHDTLGEYIASLSNDDGEGKFLNRSGYLQIANEKADGVDNIGRLDYDDYKNLNKEEFEAFIKGNTGAETVTIGKLNLFGEIKAGFDVSPKPENVFDDMDTSELESMFESNVSDSNNYTAQEIKENDFLASMKKLRKLRKDARIPNDFGLILPDLQGLTKMDTGKLKWKELSTGYIDQMNLDLGSLELRLQVFPEPPPQLTGGFGGVGMGSGGGGGGGGGGYDDGLPSQPSNRANEARVSFNGMSSFAGSIQKNITMRMVGGLAKDFASLIEDIDMTQFMSNGGSMFGSPGASGGMNGGKGSFETKTGSSNGTASGKDGKLGGGSASGQFGYESSPPRNFLPPVESFNFKNIDQPSFKVNMDITVKANFDQLDVPTLSLDLLEGFIDKTIFGDAEKLVKQMAEGAGIGNGNSSAKKSSYDETNQVNAKEKTGTEAFTEKQKKERKKELKAARADFDKIDAWYDENYKDYVGNIYGDNEEDNVLEIKKTLKIDKFNQENLNLETGLFGTNKLTPYLEMMGKQIDIFNLHQVENIKSRFLDDVNSSGHAFQKIRGIRKRNYEIDYNIDFESIFKYGIKISNENYNNIIFYNSDHGVAKAEDESDFEITLDYNSIQSRLHHSDWKNIIRIYSNYGVEKFRIFEDNEISLDISSNPNILRIKEEDFDYTIDYSSNHGVLKAKDYSEFNIDQYYSGYLRLEKLADILYEIAYEEDQYKLKASDESDYEITLDFSSQKETSKLSDIEYNLDYLGELILTRGDILYDINYIISQKIQSVVNINLNYNFEYNVDSYEQITSLEYDLNYHDISAGLRRGSDYQFDINYISDHGVLKFRHITDYELDLTIEYLKVERHNKNNNLNYELINTSIHQYEKWDHEFIYEVLKSYKEITDYSNIEYTLNHIINNYKIGNDYIILRVNGKPIKLGSKYLTIPAKRWSHVELTYDITYDHV